MEKIVIFIVLCIFELYGNVKPLKKEQLELNCLKCHTKNQIPNELIYRRYLMKYSTKKSMKQAILAYLKEPKKQHSIMPPPFFLKFPMKKALELNRTIIEKNIEYFLDTFDIKKILVLKPKN